MAMTAQMTSKMSTAYSGLSALIQAATSQLGLLADMADAESEHHLMSSSLETGYTSATSSEMGDFRDASSPRCAPYRTPMIVPEVVHGSRGGKLSFPEQLMTLLIQPANEDVCTFLPDGMYFAIRRKEFSDKLLYKHFHLTTFEEFLELIRGWGFARVNCSENIGNGHPNSNGNSNESNVSVNSSKAAIHVFRHPHFRRDQQLDMNKIRFGSKKHSHIAVDTERIMKIAPGVANAGGINGVSAVQQGSGPSCAIEKTVSDDYSASSMTAANKRRLSPSHAGQSTEDSITKEQRMGCTNHQQHPMKDDTASRSTHVAGSAPRDPCEPPQVRRSSIELRGVAQAITTSKLHLHSGETEDDDGDDDDDENEYEDDCDESMNHSAFEHRARGTKKERRSSTASLVDGGVEAATHTIVTDAIETLLFDERHTRETYKKHEKELSVSSLPGVVPISKQLFSGTPRTITNATISNAANSISHVGTPISDASSNQKQQTKTTFRISNTENASTSGDVEAATNGGRTKTSLRDVTDLKGMDGPSSSAPSPSRMEAAAALVSQSRQSSEEVTSFRPNSRGGGKR